MKRVFKNPKNDIVMFGIGVRVSIRNYDSEPKPCYYIGQICDFVKINKRVNYIIKVSENDWVCACEHEVNTYESKKW